MTTMKANWLNLTAGCAVLGFSASNIVHAQSEDSGSQAEKWRLSHDQITAITAAKEERHKELEAALKKDWDSVIFAIHLFCSCTGPSYHGFKVTRTGDSYQVVSWKQGFGGGKINTGSIQSLSAECRHDLMSKGAQYYLKACYSQDNHELFGPPPNLDSEARMKWYDAFHAARGNLLRGDRIGIEIRIENEGSVQRYHDFFSDSDYRDYGNWVSQFGVL